MADKGAGTTDLVLCRYTPGKSAEYEILSAWPREGGTLFGGREVEEMLRDYLRSKLPEVDADAVMKRCSLSKFKSWKEDYVSPALGRSEAVTEFYEFDERIEDLDIEIEEYAIERNSFEKMAADYLQGFPILVNGCLKDAGLSGDAVDLVLLTGGHSQWYFVREQLCGRLDRFGTAGLGKIQADPERIIPVPRPQETVALGLVYSPLVKGKECFRFQVNGIFEMTLSDAWNKCLESRFQVPMRMMMIGISKCSEITGKVQGGILEIKLDKDSILKNKDGVLLYPFFMMKGNQEYKCAYKGDEVRIWVAGNVKGINIGDVLCKETDYH